MQHTTGNATLARRLTSAGSVVQRQEPDGAAEDLDVDLVYTPSPHTLDALELLDVDH